jgi:hypothetical protein
MILAISSLNAMKFFEITSSIIYLFLLVKFSIWCKIDFNDCDKQVPSTYVRTHYILLTISIIPQNFDSSFEKRYLYLYQYLYPVNHITVRVVNSRFSLHYRVDVPGGTRYRGWEVGSGNCTTSTSTVVCRTNEPCFFGARLGFSVPAFYMHRYVDVAEDDYRYYTCTSTTLLELY